MTTIPYLRSGLAALVSAFAVGGLVSEPAFAAPPAPDLVTTITAPSGVAVYTSGHWVVRVRNAGNRFASNVSLTIQLPRTANSPTQYLMGTLGALTGCTRSGFTLVCPLGTIQPGAQPTVAFDITLPYSTNPIVFNATATPTTGDRNPADNSTSATAVLSTVTVPLVAPRNISNTHCTGTPTLSSFIECVPGSKSSFNAQLLPGTTPNSGVLSIGVPGYGGTWSLNGTHLTMIMTEGPDVAGILEAEGVSSTCWEGKMTFPQNQNYVAIYQTCMV